MYHVVNIDRVDDLESLESVRTDWAVHDSGMQIVAWCKKKDLAERIARLLNSDVMTPEERAAQRKSWVIGETMLGHPNMTREQAEAIYRKVTE